MPDRTQSIERFDPLPSLDSPGLARLSRWVAWVISVLLLAGGIVLWFQRIDVVVACETTLEPNAYSSPVQGLVTGKVKEVLVEDGTAVAAGQVLIVLEAGSLSRTAASLVAQIESARTRLGILEQSTQVYSELNRDGSALSARSVKLAKRERRRLRELRKHGLVDRASEYHAESAVVSGSLEATRLSLAAKSELLELEERRRSIGESIATLERELDAVRVRQQRSTVKAPKSGVIQELLVRTQGQVVTSGETLAWIVPNEELVGVAKVPASGVGFVEPGQRVRIKFRAYPFQQFGVAYGEIRSVTADSVREDTGQRSPFHLARIHLTHPLKSADGAPLKLLPGMLADAEIVLHRQRLLTALVEPWGGHMDSVSLVH